MVSTASIEGFSGSLCYIKRLKLIFSAICGLSIFLGGSLFSQRDVRRDKKSLEGLFA